MLTISTVLKELRIDNNMSQKEVASYLFLDTSYYCKIEKGIRPISDEHLIKLSELFKSDLLNIKNSLNTFETLAEYKSYYTLRDLIENKDINSIEAYLITIKNSLNTNESLLLKIYCSALVQSLKYNNFLESNNICFKALNFEYGSLNYNIQNNMNNNSTYSLFILITYNCTMLKQYDVALSICESLLEHYSNIYNDTHYIYLHQDFFFKNTYITFLNNYAYILLKKEQFKKALKYCELGLNKSFEFGFMNQICNLLESKIEILYALSNITMAKDTYHYLENFCLLTNNTIFFKETKKLIQSSYPLLL